MSGYDTSGAGRFGCVGPWPQAGVVLQKLSRLDWTSRQACAILGLIGHAGCNNVGGQPVNQIMLLAARHPQCGIIIVAPASRNSACWTPDLHCFASQQLRVHRQRVAYKSHFLCNRHCLSFTAAMVSTTTYASLAKLAQWYHVIVR